MKTDYRRYYCNIRVDATFNAENLPKSSIEDLNSRIEDVFTQWSQEMANKGLITDIGWNWSEHCNLSEREPSKMKGV